MAVLPVILYHAGAPWIPGGYLGVDVFFVISGYLITSILLEDIERGQFSIAAFYERRARRILPALFLVMVACLVPAWFLLLPADLEAFAHSLAFVSLFVSNIYFLENTDYFDAPTGEMPLIHTWSLAVEEQYYLIFPFLLAFLWRHNWRTRVAVLSVLSLASLGLAQQASGTHSQAAFFLLPFRFWELLAGTGAAIWLFRREPRPNSALALSGLLLVLAPMLYFTEVTRHPSLWTLLPVGGTCLVILFTGTGASVGRLLSSPMLVGLGLVSYSAYLWHQPLFAFARVRSLTEPSLGFMLVLGAVSLGLAWLSWMFVEQPFRKRPGPLLSTPRQVFGASGLTAGTFIALGAAGELNDGFHSRYEGLSLANYQYDNRVYQQASWEPLRQASGIRDYRERSLEFEQLSWFRNEDARRGILIAGDSHSKDLFNILSASRSAKSSFQLARYSIRPEEMANRENAFFSAPNFIDAEFVMIAPRYDEENIEAVEPAIAALKAEGKTVVLVLNTPEFAGDLTTNIADSIILPRLRRGEDQNAEKLSEYVNLAFTLDRETYSRKKTLNAALDDIGAKAGVIVLDRTDYVCSDSCVAIAPDLTKYIYDYGHVSLEGAAYYGSVIDSIGWLDPLMQK